MTIQYTANYHLAYADAQSALSDLSTVTQQVATSLDAAMGRAGYTPPDATSFAAEVSARQSADTALSTRVTTLEGLPLAFLRLATAPAVDIAAGNALVPFDTADLDTATGWVKTRTGAGATSDTRWTCPAGQGGVYQAQGSAPLAGTGGGNVPDAQVSVARLLKNGTPAQGASNVETNGVAQTLHPSSQVLLVSLVPGDYLELQVYCSAPYRYKVTPADGIAPSLSVRRVR